jgi:hypothetical protein
MVASKSGIAVGLNKGHITTRRELKAKPSNKIGVCIFRWIDGLGRELDMDFFLFGSRKMSKCQNESTHIDK